MKTLGGVRIRAVTLGLAVTCLGSIGLLSSLSTQAGALPPIAGPLGGVVGPVLNTIDVLPSVTTVTITGDSLSARVQGNSNTENFLATQPVVATATVSSLGTSLALAGGLVAFSVTNSDNATAIPLATTGLTCSISSCTTDVSLPTTLAFGTYTVTAHYLSGILAQESSGVSVPFGILGADTAAISINQAADGCSDLSYTISLDPNSAWAGASATVEATMTLPDGITSEYYQQRTADGTYPMPTPPDGDPGSLPAGTVINSIDMDFYSPTYESSFAMQYNFVVAQCNLP